MASQNGDAYDGATAVGDAAPMHIASGGNAMNSMARQSSNPTNGQHRYAYNKGKANEHAFNEDAGRIESVLKPAPYDQTRSGGGGGGGGDDGPSRYSGGHDAADLPFVDSSAYLDVKRPFLVKIKDNVRNALLELNDELIKEGRNPLISKKKPSQLIGREVYSGSFGLYEYGSQPQILLLPGRYPPMPFANWIGCKLNQATTNRFPLWRLI